jgi:hypothetical protein
LEGLWEELFPLNVTDWRIFSRKIAITRNSMKVEIKTHGVKSLVVEIQAGNPEAFPDAEPDAYAGNSIKIKHKHGRKVIIAPKARFLKTRHLFRKRFFRHCRGRMRGSI